MVDAIVVLTPAHDIYIMHPPQCHVMDTISSITTMMGVSNTCDGDIQNPDTGPGYIRRVKSIILGLS